MMQIPGVVLDVRWPCAEIEIGIERTTSSMMPTSPRVVVLPRKTVTERDSFARSVALFVCLYEKGRSNAR